MQFIVIKNGGVSRCRLMRPKEDGTYSFVNLTKDHICPCRFRDMGEAIQELDSKRERGEIECYIEQDYEAKAVKSYLAAVERIKNDKNGCYVWRLKDGDPEFVRHLYEVCDDIRDLMDVFVTLTISSADFATMAEKCPWVIHFNEKDEKYFAGYRLLVDFNLPTRNYKIDDEEHSYFGGEF